MGNRCTRPKTNDDIPPNYKPIDQSTTKKIDLSNLNLQDEDIPNDIKEALRTEKSLSLSKNEITTDDILKLVNVLKTNENLTHLYLSSIPIGATNRGIGYIGDLIRNNRSIVHLSLDNTKIDDRAFGMIIAALSLNSPSIQCLDLRSNKDVTDHSVPFLLKMAEKNHILSHCYLNDCGLSEEGKEKLRKAKSIKWYLRENT
ncbi:unnamed protein product [Rotaria sp. Silwood2]|nr:unnamed protein product [Rotaria sp. Silwood2]CAF2720368.1 unnamed protein product [Rotaria sp. Silwood2]CAF2968928.1 unnamed protein product [Rotaria sp. Silwood2]CAF3928689.1 unnamed protein product [Rotaria sp. Silwood2]CAF3966868.1 unnamed protein product [Rotaria sp. Silwood2]